MLFAYEVDKALARRYEMLKKLGKGAYGIVWKAMDKKAGKNVAVKIFDAFQIISDAQRIFREIVYPQEFGGHDNIIKLLNPSNILIDAECHVRVCDFGLVRSVAKTETTPPMPSPNTSQRGGIERRKSSSAPPSIKEPSIFCPWAVFSELVRGVPMFSETSTMNQFELMLVTR